jgi:transposase-like protein
MRKFSEEVKQDAVRLATVRGLSIAKAVRALSVHVNPLWAWMRTVTSDAAAAGTGRQSATSEQAKLTRPRSEVTTLRMERDVISRSLFR